MAGMRIVCGACHGGSVAQEYGVRMSDGTTGTTAIVGDCHHCKGTGWITHPGKWKPTVPRRSEGDAKPDATAE